MKALIEMIIGREPTPQELERAHELEIKAKNDVRNDPQIVGGFRRMEATRLLKLLQDEFKPKWFDSYGNLIKEIPEDCRRACSHAQDCYPDCLEWVRKLRFEVPRDRAIRFLRETGGWTNLELMRMPDEELAVRILWCACNCLTEDGEWGGLV